MRKGRESWDCTCEWRKRSDCRDCPMAAPFEGTHLLSGQQFQEGKEERKKDKEKEKRESHKDKTTCVLIT